MKPSKKRADIVFRLGSDLSCDSQYHSDTITDTLLTRTYTHTEPFVSTSEQILNWLLSRFLMKLAKTGITVNSNFRIKISISIPLILVIVRLR